MEDRLAALFDAVPESHTSQYAHIRVALADCPEPGTVLNWLCNSRSADLLAGLITVGRPLTHADLDAASDGSRSDAMTADYLRGLLVAYQVLPERDELSARVSRHLDRVITRHPPHAVLLRSYVRWSLLPRARRHQRLRGGGVKNRIRWAYARMNIAADFLTAMAAHGLSLGEVTQHQVDAWLAGGPGTRYEVRDFVVWAHRRHHACALEVPHRPKADPAGPAEDSHWDLLHQCLTDTELPLDVRAAGAILLLFGQHLTRIAALTTTALSTADGTKFLTLDRIPIPLPASLGQLLTNLVEHPAPTGWAANSPSGWLFPGHLPSAHLSSVVLGRRLAAHHIPNRPARTTALVAVAQELPPAILGPMLGLHPITASQWRRRAGTDWTAYLAARVNGSRRNTARSE
ncbi:hypothetical protein [Streptomyces bohaiensis]|uniref:Integrase n=1 Tax=Streptomyces bohaiensis TaxID=1431344 RepID=A0ABX1CDK5_9ACTN|nr:hypothetical protein [Streptomyces bohaiensis]NJQ17175.1 hypothetical protein [Streptomyces bohaiensis]